MTKKEKDKKVLRLFAKDIEKLTMFIINMAIDEEKRTTLTVSFTSGQEYLITRTK